ncbi:PREDICTED: cadherin-13-like, partial [Leptosomus discolor]|uniref:cadherin-13-like n=1 Tax=Leptosomus discolor TaxID=188344 RepID=UPI0005227776
NPPATGTGTLHITLEDVNDNVPSLYPTLAKVCDDAKDLRVVVLGASDKDLHPNTDPFKFELSKQSGPEKLWRITKINNTHAQVTLLQNLKKANYNIPISVTDSGKPPLTNATELKLQVCSCKKSKMDCSATDALHISMTLILLSLFSLFCL